MSQDDMFSEVVQNLDTSPNLLGNSPVVSSGVSSGGNVPQQRSFPSQESVPETLSFNCEFCSKTLKSQKGYENHVLIVHKLSKFTSVTTDLEFIYSLMGDLIIQVLQEIRSDFQEESDEVSYINEILKCSGNKDFCHFVESLSEIYANALKNKSKLLPSNEFEEYLRSLNKSFNDDEVSKKLKEQVLFLLPMEINQKRFSMVFFRLTFRLSEELYFHLLRECRKPGESAEISDAFTMSETEKEAFKGHANKMFQSYFRKLLSQNTQVSRVRKNCMTLTFVVSNHGDTVTAADILDNKVWEDGQVCLSFEAYQCFLGIEQCIMSLIEKKKSVSPVCIMEELMVLKYQDGSVLKYWHLLTSNHFAEVDSIVFLKDIVHIFTALSVRLQSDKLKREEEARQQLAKVSLRTDLKRN